MDFKIVCVKAGSNKGSFMVVVGEKKGYVLLCDGKAHPLSKPKLKNIKHIAPTNSSLKQEQLETDKSLKIALTQFNAQAE